MKRYMVSVVYETLDGVGNFQPIATFTDGALAESVREWLDENPQDFDDEDWIEALEDESELEAGAAYLRSRLWQRAYYFDAVSLDQTMAY